MSTVLLTADDIAQWKADLERIDAKILRLHAQRDDLQRKLDAAQVFLSVERQPAPVQPPPQREYGVWTNAIRGVLSEKSDGLSVAQMREALSVSGMADKLKENDKGFYGAINKLASKGEIVKDGDRCFLASAHRSYVEAVAAGLRQPIQVDDNSRSPIAKVVLDFVRQRPDGVSSAQLVAYLRSLPAYQRQIDRNATYAYNVFSRLLRRGNLIKEGKIYKFAFEENEASSGGSEEASETNKLKDFDPNSLFN